MLACCWDYTRTVDTDRGHFVGKKDLVASREQASPGHLRNVDNSDSGHHWEHCQTEVEG